MKFHIVRSGETLEKIMFMYEVTEDELKEVNKHIKNFRTLIPGSKLKIPTITENIDESIMEMEPFVEDYYPKNDIEETKEVSLIEEEQAEEVLEIVEENDFEKDVSKQNDLIDEKKEIDITKITQEKVDNQNERIKQNQEKKEKPEKASTKHKLNYYPYYYYNPYYGRYFVYYLPIYS